MLKKEKDRKNTKNVEKNKSYREVNNYKKNEISVGE